MTVTITPNGYADAVADGHFVLPDEKQCMMAEFLDKLSNPPPDRVHYIQKQNSNLTEEFPELIADSAKEMTWATKAFGCSPDAVNFWMGDGRAITSSKHHKPLKQTLNNNSFHPQCTRILTKTSTASSQATRI